MDLDPIERARETEALDGGEGSRHAAPHAGFQGKFLAHRSDLMQAARREWNDSCGPATAMKLAHDENGDLLAVVDTPKGSRNKYKWNEATKKFRLRKVLPAGAVFPWDFGYVPGTRGGDGDPLDILLLMEEPAFAGCVVPARLVGVIEAEQAEKGRKKERNDRLIAVAASSHSWQHVEEIGDLGETLLSEIEHFFVSYNRFEDRTFVPIGRFGSRRARRTVERSRAGARTTRKARKTK